MPSCTESQDLTDRSALRSIEQSCLFYFYARLKSVCSFFLGSAHGIVKLMKKIIQQTKILKSSLKFQLYCNKLYCKVIDLLIRWFCGQNAVFFEEKAGFPFLKMLGRRVRILDDACRFAGFASLTARSFVTTRAIGEQFVALPKQLFSRRTYKHSE